MSVEIGDQVKVEYTGTLDDGSIFDDPEEPIMFDVGSGGLIAGFENAIIGMETNEEKTIKLEPNEAYGDYNEKLIQQIPAENVPKDHELSVGMMVIIDVGNDRRMPAKISKISPEGGVNLDLNHPLAGKTLNFRIKIIEINKKSTKAP